MFFIFKHEGGQGRAPTAHELEKINNRYMLGLVSFDVDATARAARFAPEIGQEGRKMQNLRTWSGILVGPSSMLCAR